MKCYWIFNHLRLERKYNSEDYFKEGMAGETHVSFSSLCRTSRRLRVIAQPFLYLDVITSNRD
jgi:hypothetical protein